MYSNGSKEPILHKEEDKDKGASFKCGQCERTYKNKATLVQHQRFHKEDENLFENLYEKLEKKLENIEKKKEGGNAPGGIHVCQEKKIGKSLRQCHFIATTQQVLDNHIQFWHTKRPVEGTGIFECDMCGQIFSTGTSHKVNVVYNWPLNLYFLLQHHVQSGFCREENVAQKSKFSEVLSGRSRKGGRTNYLCRICDKGIDRPERLTEHIFREHTYIVNNHIKCKVCGSFFSNNFHLINHSKRLHNILRPTDIKTSTDESVCDNTFMSIPEHKIEVEMENTDEMAVDDPEEYQPTGESCIEVDKKSDINDQFDVEQVALVKDPVPAARCPLCKHMFTDRIILNEHMRSDHGRDNNPCPSCSSSFSRSYDLTVS
jgi:hypothetical protein